MPFDKNHTEKTVEEHFERIDKILLQNRAVVEEAYLDMLVMYETAGSSVNGLAAMLNNVDVNSVTPAQVEFAQAVYDNGVAWNQVITTVNSYADAMRKFT